MKINTTRTSLQDAYKALKKGEIIASNSYIKKEDNFQISNLCFHLKKLEKKSKINTN